MVPDERADVTGVDRTCIRCGDQATDEQTCIEGTDHRVGAEHPLGCPNCGRLMSACVKRPCSAFPKE